MGRIRRPRETGRVQVRPSAEARTLLFIPIAATWVPVHTAPETSSPSGSGFLQVQSMESGARVTAVYRETPGMKALRTAIRGMGRVAHPAPNVWAYSAAGKADSADFPKPEARNAH